MVKAGRQLIIENENTLGCTIETDEEYIDVGFHVTENVGSPWTVVMKNREYKTITLDFGKKLKT